MTCVPCCPLFRADWCTLDGAIVSLGTTNFRSRVFDAFYLGHNRVMDAIEEKAISKAIQQNAVVRVMQALLSLPPPKPPSVLCTL